MNRRKTEENGQKRRRSETEIETDYNSELNVIQDVWIGLKRITGLKEEDRQERKDGRRI
jgi:hypothetical protein